MSIRLVDARRGDYFDTLWRQAGDDLAAKRLDRWPQKVTEHLARGGRPCDLSGLGDEGVDVGAKPESPDFVQDNQRTQTQSGDTILVFYANHFCIPTLCPLILVEGASPAETVAANPLQAHDALRGFLNTNQCTGLLYRLLSP